MLILRVIRTRSTAKSRTGFLITFNNCPLLWVSKIQTEVALSTTEAEYIALSHSLREVIPLVRLLEEMQEKGIIKSNILQQIKCTVFEDNVGCVELAKAPKNQTHQHQVSSFPHLHWYWADTTGEGQVWRSAGRCADQAFTKGSVYASKAVNYGLVKCDLRRGSVGIYWFG